ncbi:hypothetical protein CR513_12342, partial [Mucuna pruriens]
MSPYKLLAGNNWLMQLDELEELCLGAYKRPMLYKGKTKKWHDKRIQQQEFQELEKVLLYSCYYSQHPKRNDWSQLLEDALWAHRTAYQTLLGMSLHRIVFGKAVKRCNLAFNQASKERKLQLQELNKLHLETYKNSKIYKEKVKCFHDNMILRKEFKVGQKVLVFNSHLKLITCKLHSKWDEPFVITNVFPYDIVEIRDETIDKIFK